MKKQLKLTSEEQDILGSFDKGEWKSVKNLKKEKDLAKKAAKNTLRKYASSHSSKLHALLIPRCFCFE